MVLNRRVMGSQPVCGQWAEEGALREKAGLVACGQITVEWMRLVSLELWKGGGVKTYYKIRTEVVDSR